MRVFAAAVLALLAPLVLSSQNICYPPKSTTVGFLTLSEAHSYSINDYENGILYFAPGGDIFGEPWTYVDLFGNVTYHKEKGQPCVYEPLDQEVREVRSSLFSWVHRNGKPPSALPLYGKATNSVLF